MKNATITIGDWSHDGHNQTDTLNLSVPDECERLDRYFDAAVKDGCPDITKFCTDYVDNKISADDAAKFIEYFGNADDVFNERVLDEGDYYLDYKSYAKIWVATVNRGLRIDGIFGEVKIVEADGFDYKIGGYGLYSEY